MTENIEMQNESRGMTASTLKTIAIIAMLIDHIAHVFVPGGSVIGSVMNAIGRITGPVMFYFVAEGYHYTRNVNRYTFRLALFAVISYLPFIFCFGHTWPGNPSWLESCYDLNVIYTIFLGLLVIRARREMKNPVLKLLAIVLLIWLSSIGDWAIEGIFIMLAFDYYRGNFKQQAFAYSLIMGPSLIQTLAMPVWTLMYKLGPIKESINLERIVSQSAMFLPILLLSYYNGKKGHSSKVSKWGFYIFYPLHLTILGFLYLWINK